MPQCRWFIAQADLERATRKGPSVAAPRVELALREAAVAALHTSRGQVSMWGNVLAKQMERIGVLQAPTTPSSAVCVYAALKALSIGHTLSGKCGHPR